MLPRHALPAMLLTGLLAACGSGGPPRKVHPSTASIQQLAVQADGSWKITLRIQNYSTFAMHYRRIDAGLSIDGKELGRLEATPDIDIVGNNGDVVETTFRPAAKTMFGTDIAYALKGTIETSEPNESFTFETASRLTPVPGVPDTYR
ncbi:LEA type 2 family protein [Dokdonella sp.]|uniref:LEA type 2 family protein n=1 Tax=Dokdonella sp. TaxID=2291710 RepID=UPI002F3E7E62